MASLLVLASALIVFGLGTLHLVYTFSGPKLRPRDPEVEARLKSVSPGITRQTTMWKAWVGFNASHGIGAMLFGAAYGYLAVVQPQLLFHSAYLLGLGGVVLLSYLALAKLYWFSAPLRGIALAAACYVAGLCVSLVD